MYHNNRRSTHENPLINNSMTIERPVTRSLSKLQNLNDLISMNSHLESKESVINAYLNQPVVKPPPTYQKIISAQQPINLIQILENSMLTGKRPKSIVDVSLKRFYLVLKIYLA